MKLKVSPKNKGPKIKAGQPGAKLSALTSQKNPVSAMPQTGQSPPTKDPGPRQLEENKQTPLSLEIHKLQSEVEVYIQKVEELAKRGKSQKCFVTSGLCPTFQR